MCIYTACQGMTAMEVALPLAIDPLWFGSDYFRSPLIVGSMAQ